MLDITGDSLAVLRPGAVSVEELGSSFPASGSTPAVAADDGVAMASPACSRSTTRRVRRSRYTRVIRGDRPGARRRYAAGPLARPRVGVLATTEDATALRGLPSSSRNLATRLSLAAGRPAVRRSSGSSTTQQLD